jgi:hypothetical protein
MPSVYAPVGGAKAEPGHTFYQVFTGPGALYPTPESWVRVPDVTDGTSYTLLAVEGAEAVPWTKPQDVPFDADPRKPLPKLGGLFDGDCNACLCDGAVLFIPRKAPEKVVRALITRAGGEELRLSQVGLTAAEWGELLENGGPRPRTRRCWSWARKPSRPHARPSAGPWPPRRRACTPPTC